MVYVTHLKEIQLGGIFGQEWIFQKIQIFLNHFMSAIYTVGAKLRRNISHYLQDGDFLLQINTKMFGEMNLC